MTAAPRRCGWAASGDALMLEYHDREWGVPVHDDRRLFEMLVLEGAQAGLSWSMILNKREGYRHAFAGFDAATVAGFSARDRARLLRNAGIVRNRLKIEATVSNARRFLELCDERGSFDGYLWAFVGGSPLDGRRRGMRNVPARTALSDEISRDLRKRGFRFVGSTIVYAFLQAVGVVNDHLTRCFRYPELARPRR